MSEILNIEYHVKRLVLLALNKSARQFEAAKLLGVSERTLARYKKQFNIGYSKRNDEFYFKGEKAILMNQQPSPTN
jgi:hypothetical protein